MKIAFVYNKQREKTIEEAEFDSPEVISSIVTALKTTGHNIEEIEMTKDGSWLRKLKDFTPDLVFNTAEGFKGIGRESFAPIALEQMDLKYVGSGPYTCFLTLDKYLTKQMVASVGVPTPESFFLNEEKELKFIEKEISFPVLVKPNFEGSSKGISSQSRCNNLEELRKIAKKILKDYPEGILIEKFVEGKDVTIPFIGDLGDEGVLESIEYTAYQADHNWIYDYDLKNNSGEKIGLNCPAEMPENTRDELAIAMKKVSKILRIFDMGRADFRITPSGDIYFLEFNPLPSLHPNAGIFAATKRLGLDYNQTIAAIISAAVKRHKAENYVASKPSSIRKKDPRVALVFNLKRKTHDDEGYEEEAEFDSPKTVQAIQDAIAKNGYDVVGVEADQNLATELKEQNVDVVFNIAEGINKRTREAQVPAICDLLGIEHTGGDATCLAVTLDKVLTNKIVRAEGGIKVPKSKLILKRPKQIRHNLKFPVIVKPNLEGTSKGIYDNSVTHNDQDLLEAVYRLWDKGMHNILCQEYIVGREFTIGVIGKNTLTLLGPMEIEFKKEKGKFPVYSFEAKQADNPTDNEYYKIVCPVDLGPVLNKKVDKFAKRCFKAIGCRDVGRIDFKVTEDGNIYFIEINPLPGLNPGYSDLSVLAERSGWTYEQLIGNILKPAVQRWRKGQG